MASSKPSGLARFTSRAPAAPVSDPSPPDVLRPLDATAADASRPSTAMATPQPSAKPKLVGVYLMPGGHRQLKIEAAKRGMTVSDLVRDALNAWFANEHLPPLA